MRTFARYLLVVLVVALSSCSDDKEPVATIDDTDRTVLVYMVANNNLSEFASQNIDEMLAGASKSVMRHGRLLVYYVPQNSAKQELFEVVVGKNGVGTKKLLKEYSNNNSLTTRVMQQVIADTKKFAPAQSYGIVLWSHALGWFPSNALLKSVRAGVESDLWQKAPNAFITKWFGYDGGHDMEIATLASALTGSEIYFDFIVFDCCFMSSIEVWYQLRHCAKYIISSAAEVMGGGFPYTSMVALFLAREFNPRQVAECYIDYYRNSTSVAVQSGTISYVVSAELEALAQQTRQIYTTAAGGAININSIQAYETMRTHMFHDFDQYIAQLCTDNALYDRFVAQLRKTIPFEAHTPQVYSAYNGLFDLPKSCGVTTYIPRQSLEDKYGYTTSYLKTAWAQAVGLKQ